MRVVYFAEDGTQFENEDECAEYEFYKQYESAFAEGKIVMYDIQKNPMTYDATKSGIPIDEVYYIRVNDPTAYDILHDLAYMSGYSLPKTNTNRTGLWFWSEEEYKRSEWIFWDEVYENLMEIIKGFERD